MDHWNSGHSLAASICVQRNMDLLPVLNLLPPADLPFHQRRSLSEPCQCDQAGSLYHDYGELGKVLTCSEISTAFLLTNIGPFLLHQHFSCNHPLCLLQICGRVEGGQKWIRRASRQRISKILIKVRCKQNIRNNRCEYGRVGPQQPWRCSMIIDL